MLPTGSVNDEFRLQFVLDPSDKALSNRRAVGVNDIAENRLRCRQGVSLHVVCDRDRVHAASLTMFS
jgi:hypothetical protein